MTKRKVTISDEPRHRRRQSHAPDKTDLGIVTADRLVIPQSIPTGDHRHCTSVREGRISFEVFQKSRLKKIPVDSDTELAGEREIHRAESKIKSATTKVLRSGEAGQDDNDGSKKTGAKGKSVQANADSRKKAKARKKSPEKKVTKRG